MYPVPSRPSVTPTIQIQIELMAALLASSTTSATNQPEVPKITIGSVCLTG